MNVEVIILRQIKFKDASIILHALSDEYGKISILAKGAYRRRDNLMSAFETFSIDKMILSKGMNMFYYNNVSEASIQYFLYDDPISFRAAHLVSEIILKTMIDNFSVEHVYPLTKEFILNLQDSKSKILLASGWLIKFISFMGYKPFFDYKNTFVYITEEGISSFKEKNYTAGYKQTDIKIAKFIEVLLKMKFKDISEIAINEYEALGILETILYYFLLTVDNIKIHTIVDLQKYIKVDNYGYI